jgi:sporulation protein YlmC with PRC-barrel domain
MFAFCTAAAAEKMNPEGESDLCFDDMKTSTAQKKKQNYKATFVDNMNITTYVNNVQYQCDYNDKSSANNKFVIYGTRGKSTVTIPWSKIKRIDFIDERENYNARVNLKDGRGILIYAELSNSKYTGENDFGGSFKINAEYVRAIIFN